MKRIMSKACRFAVKYIKLRTWIALGMFFVLFPLVILTLFKPGSAEAEWFNDAWGYRQPWSFTHNAALSDQRVTFTFDTTSAPDKIQADCDDIRFTDQNGKLLRHQFTGTCDNASSTFDVIVPSVVNGLNAGYIYYGNPGASSASENISAFTSLSPSGGAPAFAAEAKGEGPIAYWAMDEGYSTTLQDSTTNNKDGTFGASTAAPTWKQESDCLSGKCVYFDGGDEISLGTDSLPTGAFTVSIWARPNIIPTDGGATIDFLYWQQETQIYVTDTNKIGARFYTGSSYTVTSGAGAVSINKWHHIVFTYDASFINLYVDGKLVAGPTAATGDRASGISYFGRDETANNITGYLDDAKIYNYARTAAQIKTDFVGKGTSQGVSARFGAQDTAFLNDGLVGYWPVDETATPAVDKSGNGLNGTWGGNTASITGKFGLGTDFDGTLDYLDMTDATVYDNIGSGNHSLFGWVKADTLSVSCLIMKGPYRPGLKLNASGKITFANDTDNQAALSITSITTGEWYHVGYTLDGNTANIYINGALDSTTTVTPGNFNNASSLRVGGCTSTGTDFDGKIDEPRVYNRALSAKEAQALYSWAPGPVGHWKMDEGAWTNNCSTDTVFDTSGNAIHGDACPNSTGPTTPTSGKFGKAGNFDGSNDYVDMGDATLLRLTSAGTAEAWVYPKSYPSGGAWKNVINKGNWGAGRNYYTIYYQGSDNTIRFDIGDSDSSNTTSAVSNTLTPLNTWSHIAIAWDGTTIRAFVNGVQAGSVAQVDTPNTSTYSFQIASVTASHLFDGYIDDVRVYNYGRTAQQIVEDMNGGHPAGGSPVASQLSHFRFDEQSTETTNNSGLLSSNSVGTKGGSSTAGEADDPTWKTKSDCKVNGCLSFDGGDYVDYTGDSNYQIGIKTVTFWAKPSSGISTTAPVLSLSGANWYAGFTSSNRMFTSHSVTAGTQQTTASDNDAYTADAWSHFAYVFSVSGSNVTIKMYVNGRMVKTTIYATGYSATYGTDVIVGAFNSTTFFYTGSVDELKFYNSELTDEQVRIDMNAGGGINFGVGTDESATAYGGPGGNPPVGYWTFDEGMGTTANDISGNGNTGTITAGTGSYDAGKVGRAYNFDNADTSVNAGSGSTLDNLPTTGLSLSAWIYPKSQGEGSASVIAAKNVGTTPSAGWLFRLAGTNALTFTVDGSTDLVRTTSNSILTTNAWNHVEVSWDGVITTAASADIYVNGVEVSYATTTNGAARVDDGTSTFYIGNDSTSARTFDGKIDELKVYNYARSVSQIAYDYSRGGPVGWWKFDECSGTTANDSSGFTNNGTITPGAGTNTAAGTCTSGNSAHMWNDGATGKYNSSLGFDATDDHVVVTSSSSIDMDNERVSLSAWVKWNGGGSSNYIIDKASNKYNLSFTGAAGRPTFYVGGFSGLLTAPTAVSTGVWHHLAGTYDGTTAYLYVNGVVVNSLTTGASVTTGGNLFLGCFTTCSATYSFDGLIDDIRIYNYPLSATQIKKLYNEGGGVRFGPLQGSP